MSHPSDDPAILAHRVAFGEGPELSADEANWLRNGLRRYLNGQETALDVALGLHGAARVVARNRALLRAARLIDAGRNLSPWDLAGHLTARIRRFEAVHAARVRVDGVEGLDDINTALAEAFASGSRVMQSRRRLYDLLATDKPVATCQ